MGINGLNYYIPIRYLLISFSLVQAGEGKLTMKFTGELNDKMRGFYRAKYMHEGEERYNAVTQFEVSNGVPAAHMFHFSRFVNLLGKIPFQRSEIYRGKIQITEFLLTIRGPVYINSEKYPFIDLKYIREIFKQITDNGDPVAQMFHFSRFASLFIRSEN